MSCQQVNKSYTTIVFRYPVFNLSVTMYMILEKKKKDSCLPGDFFFGHQETGNKNLFFFGLSVAADWAKPKVSSGRQLESEYIFILAYAKICIWGKCLRGARGG